MNKAKSASQPPTHFVAHLPDLITEEDYLDPPTIKKVRMRLRVTDEGVEVLGDSMYAVLVEQILADMDATAIERMLCG